MAVSHVFLLVLVIGIVHHSHGRTYESESITINGTDTSPVKAPGHTNYDYFSLVLQWPKSFCNTGVVTCTSPIPDYFIVHGLWPQLHNGQMTTCYTAFNKLNYAKLDSMVLQYLNIHWPNLKARPNNISPSDWLWGRWDYEYQKHGSCFWPFQFQTQPLLYPRETFEMANQIGNVAKMLFQQGRILPDNKRYYLREFENAVRGQLNVMPRLRCNYARGPGGSRIFQLYEIEFCFNKKKFNNKWVLMNCERNSNCGNSQVQPGPRVMFPRPQ